MNQIAVKSNKKLNKIVIIANTNLLLIAFRILRKISFKYK